MRSQPQRELSQIKLLNNSKGSVGKVQISQMRGLVAQTPQKPVKIQRHELSHQSVPAEDNIEHDQTVISFLKTMETRQINQLKDSLRSGQSMTSNNSLQDRIMNRLQHKFQSLPPDKRIQYLEALDKVEQGKSATELFVHMFQATSVPIQLIGNVDTQTLTLRILSNYGNPEMVGLTEVQIFDNRDTKIPIVDVNCPGFNGVGRICNGNTFTINEEYMWYVRYKKFPIDINFRISIQHSIGSIKVWNFNKDLKSLNIGIRLIEVLLNDTSLVSCEVRKGLGTIYTDYSQTIKLPLSINTDRREDHIDQVQYQDTPNQRFQLNMNITQQSGMSKRSEESVGGNKETFISNTSHNLSRLSNKTYKPPRMAGDPFDEERHLRKSSVSKQTRESQHYNLSDQKVKEPSQHKIPTVASESSLNSRIAKIQITNKQSVIKHSPIFNNYISLNPDQKKSSILQEFRKQKPKSKVIVPTLPQGRYLTLKLIRSWGDKNFVGLSAVEVFNQDGNQVRMSADPEYAQLSRESNLLTCDERYMYMKQGNSAELIFDLGDYTQIALIRLWNYNKSRTYSSRGVRDIKMFLDDVEIFQGEIKKAFGTLGFENCEYIMFTSEERIIQRIEAKDWINDKQPVLESTIKLNRPDTATFKRNMDKTKYASEVTIQQQFKFAQIGVQSPLSKMTTPSARPVKLRIGGERVTSATKVGGGVKAKMISVQLLKSWGDRKNVGLLAVEFMDRVGSRLKIKQVVGTGNVRRLISGETQSIEAEKMWLAPAYPPPIVRFMFESLVDVAFIKVWNYNKPTELDCGCAYIKIYADEQLISPQTGILLRRGSGLEQGDFSQKFTLPYNEVQPPRVERIPKQNLWNSHEQDYETAMLPQGMKLKVNILSTWGDQFYVGLNGIEICDVNGGIIPLTKLKVIAKPSSVRELPLLDEDVRTPDKLIDGHGVTLDDRHMWLAPLTIQEQMSLSLNPSFGDVQPAMVQSNTIQFLFDDPIQFSAVSFYNYAKTPHRGAREIEMFLDDKLIYKGFLNISTLVMRDTTIEGNNKTTIVFTDDQDIVSKVSPASMRQSILGTDTLLYNENQKMTYHFQVQNEQFRSLNQYYEKLQRPTTRVKGI